MADVMLAAGGIDPTRVSRVLRRVDPGTVRVAVASTWFRRFWARGIAAVCLPWAIYVQPGLMERFETSADPERVAVLIAHELTHLEQYRRLGALRHGFRYLSDYLVGRRRGLDHGSAYGAIGLEREARYVADVIATECAA